MSKRDDRTEITFLNVPFKEKDEAKALGARWNPERRLWFVPAGADITLFQRWLPAPSSSFRSAEQIRSSSLVLQEPSGTYALDAARSGWRLSQLLAEVSSTVNRLFQQGVWTEVEVVHVQLRGEHVFLELSERDAQANVIAQARAVIWGRVARTLLPRFEKETKMQLAPGIKLLVRAKPSFHIQYGFSLIINDIDFRFSLGDLEAKKQAIIKQLKQEGLYAANKLLPAPWNYERVLVISPPQAAGLGDFQADAEHLQQFGLCEFVYVHARFQGEGAAQELRQALLQALDAYSQDYFDAVVIIRGGGAVNDLAWLNDYDLARTICQLGIPVHTGIGHERDHTVLDEVAQHAFDTPSKVIAGIWQVIRNRASEAQQYFNQVHRDAQQSLFTFGRALEQQFALIQSQAKQRVGQVRLQVQESIASLRQSAQSQLSGVRGELPRLVTQVYERSFSLLNSGRIQSHQYLQHIQHDSWHHLDTARHHSTALFREIVGQGPVKTLERGFAVVRDEQGGLITDAQRVQSGQMVHIELRTGCLEAQVKGIQSHSSSKIKE